MERMLRKRWVVSMVAALIGLIVASMINTHQLGFDTPPSLNGSKTANTDASGDADKALQRLEVKGRAAKTGYARSQFGDGWTNTGGCDTRNIILRRDLTDTTINSECKVERGVLYDPYTGKQIIFMRGADTSDDVQIDHVVALSDAWQKGAQQLDREMRQRLANDPLELLAVDGASNQAKSDGDAATWLPANKQFRCRYVARQIAVKEKYSLWVTEAEKKAISLVLATCPGQTLPTP